MDNASFIATLSQELREEVLLTSDDAFLATLPPHLVAEAALLRERENDFGRSLHHSFGMSRRHSQNASSRQENPARTTNTNVNKVQVRKLIQVIDEGSVTYILKLLFLVQPVTKALMNKVLLHIAAHDGTRDVAVRFLLNVILQSCDQNSKNHEMYGYSANNTVSDAFVPITICKRAVEALCHLAMYQNEVCKTLLKDNFLEEQTVKDFQNLLITKLQFLDKTDLQPDKKAISSLISFLATETATKSVALQEQVLQLLNTTVQFVEKSFEEDSANGKASVEGTKFSMPKVSVLELHCLTQTLTVSGNSTKCMERLTSLFKSLSWNPINLVACISHLIAEVKAEGEKSKVALELFLKDCKESKNMSLETFIGEQDYKLLRLVKMLRALWPAKSTDPSSEESNSEEMLIDSVSRRSLGEAVELQHLWHLLGECLSMLERTESNSKSTGHGSLSPALCRMQPLFEAFLVVKAPDSAKNAVSSKGAGKSSTSMEVEKAADGECSPSRNSSALNVKEFVSFAEQHRHTLNMYIRQDKTLLHSVAFSPLVRYPKLLDFDNKKHYFRSELKKRTVSQRYNSIRINVRRDYVFEDSFHQIVLRKPDELKGRLTVTFNGEEGVDAGGLTREWYLILSKQMLNPDKALFIHSANGLTYQPNPASTIQPDHLKYFKFAGQIVGKAIWDEQLLDSHFTLSMYKHMLNQPIEYTDVESIDPEYFRNLGWMLNNDITDILEETFSIVREQFGEMLTIDLKPNGRNVPVTEENKHEYVQLVAEQQMTKGIKEQIDAFKEGFHQLMPPDLISIFTCAELELLMCGLPTIDVQDLRLNTEYTGYTRESPQIQWFWNIVQALSQEDLARLLQFVTGTSQVPMDGFKALRGMNGPQKFNIHRCGDKKRLPSSHTCFNQLDLPEYSSEEELSRYLLSAVREGFEGFGFS
uniref:HECT-type E3 ubiquitin transferase n=1 Tax=Hanusia phi TaxID=3032 RepID=A0A7S0HI01_9CRYP